MTQESRQHRGESLGKALARSLTGAVLGDRWIIEGLIGVGGMGVVLGATDGPDGAPVVAKVIAPQLASAQWAAFVKASRREALALRRLSARRPPSPYIVRFFDEGEVEVQVVRRLTASDSWSDSDSPQPLPVRYLILEYVDGGPHGTTLHERIHRSLGLTNKGFLPSRARRLLRHIARALSDIHAERLVHRDLKPTNVLIAGPPGEEVAKVTDFGIVRVQDDTSTAGVVAVSVGYSAPEQYIPGNTEVGPESDIFSFGALAYEVLTGCALFPQDAQAALAAGRRSHRHSLLDAPTIHEAYTHAPQQVHAIDRLIAYATSSKLEDRPADVRDLWKELDAHLLAIENATAPTSDVVGSSNRMSIGTMPAVRASILSANVFENHPDLEFSGVGTPSLKLDKEPLIVERIESVEREKNERIARTPQSEKREEAWQWRIRGRSEGADALRDVAFGEDGKALAVGDAGVRYWDGGAWLEIPLPNGVVRDAFSCVARIDPDRYVLGGRDGMLAFLARGDWQILKGTDPSVSFTSLWGNEQGVLVAAGARPNRSAVIWCARGGEWLPPKKIPGVSLIHSVSHVGADLALAAGEAIPRVSLPQQQRVGALIAISLLNGELRDLRGADAELPVTTSVASSRFGETVLVGHGGFAARVIIDGPRESFVAEIRPERVETRRHLMGVRFDASSQVWAVAAGRILARTIANDGRPLWKRIWWGTGDGPSLLRLFPSEDRLLAFTREGLVVEGRAPGRQTKIEKKRTSA